MTASVTRRQVSDHARLLRSRIDSRVYARPCHCERPRVFRPNECHRCGRELRPISDTERRALNSSEGLAVLDAAIERRRRDINLEIEDATGCASLRTLLRETYWLHDAQRAGWVPE